MPSLILIAHNVRSLHNVGAFLRTADGCGVSQVYFTGITPAPTNKLGSSRSKIEKVALGAEKSVSWRHVKSLSSLIRQLKHDGYHLVALEQDKQAHLLFTWKPKKERIALLVGNEVKGIDPRTLRQVDSIVEIPMRGSKESLNVSVATGIALYVIAHTLDIL